MGSQSVTTGPPGQLSPLTATDWAVLGFLAERPRHGFDIARELAPSSPLGRVWTVSRPLVYRSLERLRRRGWVRVRGSERGHQGPEREILEVTGEGNKQFVTWLREPVRHLRDVRSLLLLKLYFLGRRGESASALRDDQRRVLQTLTERLAGDQAGEADGFERLLLAWRLHFAQAVDGFLEEAG